MSQVQEQEGRGRKRVEESPHFLVQGVEDEEEYIERYHISLSQ